MSSLQTSAIQIGKRNRLAILRDAAPGFYLEGAEFGEILLPHRYVPKSIRPGDKIEVFIYFDSEDRLIATTEHPLAAVGDFACLRVVGINRNIGTFLNWGLSKDLLLPFREQLRPLRAGDEVVVAVYVDPRSERIAASMRLQRHLSRNAPNYSPNQAVSLLVSAETPLGYSAIVENAHLGLLYRDALPGPLKIGQTTKGYVRAIRPGGKIDLSLDQTGYTRVAPLKQQILKALEANGGHLPFDDSTPPETIRQQFGVSKNAFKQALGPLYKARRIKFTASGVTLINTNTWSARS